MADSPQAPEGAQQPEVPGSSQTQTPQPGNGAVAAPAQPPEKTFNQAQLDAIVQARLAKENEKRRIEFEQAEARRLEAERQLELMRQQQYQAPPVYPSQPNYDDLDPEVAAILKSSQAALQQQSQQVQQLTQQVQQVTGALTQQQVNARVENLIQAHVVEREAMGKGVNPQVQAKMREIWGRVAGTAAADVMTVESLEYLARGEVEDAGFAAAMETAKAQQAQPAVVPPAVNPSTAPVIPDPAPAGGESEFKGVDLNDPNWEQKFWATYGDAPLQEPKN